MVDELYEKKRLLNEEFQKLEDRAKEIKLALKELEAGITEEVRSKYLGKWFYSHYTGHDNVIYISSYNANGIKAKSWELNYFKIGDWHLSYQQEYFFNKCIFDEDNPIQYEEITEEKAKEIIKFMKDFGSEI